jgi:hypothetical protein
MNTTLMLDGRAAFTCVNSTEWLVVDGTLYMNSCGMYGVSKESKETTGTLHRHLPHRHLHLENTSATPVGTACTLSCDA